MHEHYSICCSVASPFRSFPFIYFAFISCFFLYYKNFCLGCVSVSQWVASVSVFRCEFVESQLCNNSLAFFLNAVPCSCFIFFLKKTFVSSTSRIKWWDLFTYIMLQHDLIRYKLSTLDYKSYISSTEAGPRMVLC